MKYVHFTNWEPAKIDDVLQHDLAKTMQEYDNGNKKPLTEYYRERATITLLQNGFSHLDIGSTRGTGFTLSGIVIDTDLYNGPYPNKSTYDAVDKVVKAAQKRKCRYEICHMFTGVRVFTEE